ncbi:MAG: AraC family transcriptional regulator [Clostridiaceae bacterium]|nr:AraC family transcriptional regulator [Clostridiaceae bacterium]
MKPKYTNSARYKCLEYLKKHSVDLYLSYCGMEECDPGHYYGPIARSEYLIHYILSGKGMYQVDGKTYHLGKHNAFIIYPNEITFYQADKDDPWTYIWVGFGGAKAESCLNYASLNKNNRVGIFKCKDELLGYVKGMLNASKLTYANDLKREGFLFMFLSALINENNTNEQHGVHDYPYQIYVEHALEFIDHNYEKDIKVIDIANYIGIDRSYLTNIFKKSMNISPQQYLINYRLEKACNLLKSTNLSISEISEKVGYPDPLSFSKIFKMYYDISPTKYRDHIEELVKASKKGE